MIDYLIIGGLVYLGLMVISKLAKSGETQEIANASTGIIDVFFKAIMALLNTLIGEGTLNMSRIATALKGGVDGTVKGIFGSFKGLFVAGLNVASEKVVEKATTHEAKKKAKSKAKAK